MLVVACLLLVFMTSTRASVVAHKSLLSAATLRPLRTAALRHRTALEDLLYPHLPAGADRGLKARTHAVRAHPVYNFLHTYYRYSSDELKLFSPGQGTSLVLDDRSDLDLLHPKFRRVEEDGSGKIRVQWTIEGPLPAEGRFGWMAISRTRDILTATAEKSPNLGCFGLHEWAMLYREKEKYQKLPLRVPPAAIDAVIQQEGVKCSHFDAYRFFHDEAKPLNAVRLSREVQVQYEQPACIHATMDLFKYAFKIYPLCSSDLVEQTLRLALVARKIDMRASPYDVSAFEGCEEPICVETPEGRKQYIKEQQELMTRAAPLRKALLDCYNDVLSASVRVV